MSDSGGFTHEDSNNVFVFRMKKWEFFLQCIPNNHVLKKHHVIKISKGS